MVIRMDPAVWVLPVVLAAAACLLAGCSAQAADRGSAERIVFLGDSITDGFSYPLLVRQALAEAHKPLPVCVNAGIGGDTAAGMRKRLDRDVLVHRPTLMTISVGVNDVLRSVPLADYEADVRAILERMKKASIPVLVLTTSVLGGKTAEADKRLAGHNEILRRLAGEFGCRVGEVYALMDKARRGGRVVLEEDFVHPNYQGHRVMARAVLDALGHRDVPVPAQMVVRPLPGLVTPWKLRAVTDPKARPLDANTVVAVRPDATFKTLAVPEQTPQKHWWSEQTRQRGYALSLAEVAGKAPRYVGVATVSAGEAHRAYFNVGADLQAIWLNGRQIYKASPEWQGYHAGRERIAAELKAGANTVVIETGGQFFLSVTDNNDW